MNNLRGMGSPSELLEKQYREGQRGSEVDTPLSSGGSSSLRRCAAWEDKTKQVGTEGLGGGNIFTSSRLHRAPKGTGSAKTRKLS